MFEVQPSLSPTALALGDPLSRHYPIFQLSSHLESGSDGISPSSLTGVLNPSCEGRGGRGSLIPVRPVSQTFRRTRHISNFNRLFFYRVPRPEGNGKRQTLAGIIEKCLT